ncbi:hypothetical protein JCM11641_001591 [Rhodosporidiobolus odoratus]
MPPARNRCPRASEGVSHTTSSPNAGIDVSQLTSQNILAELCLREATSRIRQQHADTRPRTTRLQYDPKQAEFKVWCDQQGFAGLSAQAVTGEKLALFLMEEVVDRPPRKTGPKPKPGAKKRAP